MDEVVDYTRQLTLAGGKSTNHDQPGTHSGEQAGDAKLTSHLDETASDSLARKSLGLVDLGEEGIGGLGDDGGSETSGQTRGKIEGAELARAEFRFGDASEVDGLLEGNFVDTELGHGVRHLLEQDGTETAWPQLDARLLQAIISTYPE